MSVRVTIITTSDMLVVLMLSLFAAALLVWTIESRSLYFYAAFAFWTARIYGKIGPRVILRIS